MAIVKMSKIQVIGLLEDKEKVYNFLQNNAYIHMVKTEYGESKTKVNENKSEELEKQREEIDKLIQFMDLTLDIKEDLQDKTVKDIYAIKDRKQEIELKIKDLMVIKDEINEIRKEIEDKKEKIVTLISNNDEKLSTLKQNKIITFEFEEDCLAKEYIAKLRAEISKEEENLDSLNNEIKGYENCVVDIKLYRELLAQEISKANGDNMILSTENTFIMEFFTPTEKEGIVEEIKKLSPTIVAEKISIGSEETVPTLTKNNKLIKQAEVVTNMYSVPSYKERDPNFLVFWFFLIFFGYIMADIGIGISLCVICYTLAHRIKENNGSKRLWTLVGTGGIFTIFWGIMYNSFFGFSIFPVTIMPDPQSQTILTLLICLLMGVLHISCAYFMKGLNAIKSGSVIDAILDGFLWDTFFLGGLMALTKFLLDFFEIGYGEGAFSKILSAIQIPGLIILSVSLLIIVVFAGRNTKGIFGKIIKGFSSLYGIVNLMSDILSYARLFGLMLSGAIIGQQFDQIGVGLLGKGFLGAILGVIVIIIGNAFNLAMGALGAYIHDCRLQYIEYFGKFYTGEGTLFTPFKPEYKYIKVNSEN